MGLRDPALKSLLASLFVATTVYLGLRIWIVTTISIGPVNKLYALSETAAVISGLTTYLATFVLLYLEVQDLESLES